ncbi:MAG TPA: ABC transporter permease [Vicinamibacterales bacterium]|nr:ABC transporter permease [Vicinamibacterales bacterium]
MRDFRLAVRSLLRVPVFAAVAVLTLAIGLGTTTLMFTTANAAFLQPLPFRSDGLVRLWQVSPRSSTIAIPPQVWRDWRQELKSVSALAAAAGAGSVNVSNGPDADRAVAASVSRNFFDTFGVSPVVGRGFSAEEATPNGPVAVVISHGLWDRFFGRAADVLARRLVIEGVACQIVGVLPADFNYPQNADLWVTFERLPDPNRSRTAHEYEVIGRLADGATLATAQAELEAVTRNLHVADADMRSEGYGVRAADLRADLLDSSTRPVTLLMAAVACLLLIACANVVNLLLARSVSRQGQTTLRIALGASKRDIMRIFVMESLALSVAGGLLGALLMIWAGDLATGLIPETFTKGSALRPDLTVFLVLVALMFLVGLLCGLVPARHASHLDLRTTLAAGSPSLASEPRAMRVMVGFEVALGVMLVAGAGLFVNSLVQLEGVDPGFRREGAVVATFNLGSAPGSAYETPQARARFFDRLLEDVGTVPGVRAAGVTSSFPFAFSPNALLEEEGVPLGQWGKAPSTHYRIVGGAYFEAMGVALRGGRLFGDADRIGAPLVAIVNEATVRILWNGENPIGRRVRMRNVDNVEAFATIVGVVADMRHRGLTRPAASEVYFPYRQRPVRTFGMTLVAQSDIDAASLTTSMRVVVRKIDPAVPVRLAPITDTLDTQLAAARFRTRLFAGFATTAVALAAFGIFGVVSYMVAARKREMGIRLALGARAAHVRRLVLRRALSPVIIGLVAGVTAALFASRLLSGLLFGIDRSDPVTYAVAGGLLLGAAVAAAWWPAHRATRVDPLTTLRAQ